MEELLCESCGEQIGWIVYSGPRGGAYCNDCKEEEDRKDADESVQI